MEMNDHDHDDDDAVLDTLRQELERLAMMVLPQVAQAMVELVQAEPRGWEYEWGLAMWHADASYSAALH